MNFAQDNNSSSRVTGFGIVVLIHVLLIWAIASGLAKKVVQAVAPIETKIVEEVKKPPPPPEKVVPPPPDLKAPPPPFIPPPEVTVTAPPPPTPAISVQSNTPPAHTDVRPTPAPAPAAPAPAPKPVSRAAAANCTKMGKPDLPAVNWAGRAEYRVSFNVKAGRVDPSSIVFTAVKGVPDRKAARALTGAIQSTLIDTYECPGDHSLEQEFVLNIE